MELANAEWWSDFWANVGMGAFFIVVVALAVELAAERKGHKYSKIIDKAKDLALEERKQENLKLSLQLANEQKARTQLTSGILRRDFDLMDLTIPPPEIKGVNVILRWMPGDDEARLVADRIKLACEGAKWKLVDFDPNEIDMKGQISVGITMVTPQKLAVGDPSQTAAELLSESLSKLGVRSRVWPVGEKLPANTLQIVVGPSDRLLKDPQSNLEVVPFNQRFFQEEKK
jgi:hypothetical protein